MINWLFGIDWLSLMPWLGTLVAVIFGIFQNTGKTIAKAEAKHAEMKANGEKRRADLAEEVTQTIIKQNKENEKKINETVKAATDTRDYFS